MSKPENIAAVAEAVCETPSTSFHRRSQQLNISETSLRRFFNKDLGMKPYKVQLVQELKKIYLPAITLQKIPILAKKNHLYRWSSFWSWRVCRNAKLSHLGHRKPAHIHWIADAPKTSHSLVRILVQKHNWAIFLRKWARKGSYKNWRVGYWQHLFEFLSTKMEEEDISNICFQLDGAMCHTAESTLDI